MAQGDHRRAYEAGYNGEDLPAELSAAKYHDAHHEGRTDRQSGSPMQGRYAPAPAASSPASEDGNAAPSPAPASESPTRSRVRSSTAPRSRPSTGTTAGPSLAKTTGKGFGRLVTGKKPHSVAGVFFGATLFALGTNFIDGGPSQAWGWVKAKFINQPFGTSTAVSPSSATSSTTKPGAAVSYIPPATAQGALVNPLPPFITGSTIPANVGSAAA